MFLWRNAFYSYAAFCSLEPCRNEYLHLRTHLYTLAHPVGPDTLGNRGSGRSHPYFHRTRDCHILCHSHIHQHLQGRILTSDRPSDNQRQMFMKTAEKQQTGHFCKQVQGCPSIHWEGKHKGQDTKFWCKHTYNLRNCFSVNFTGNIFCQTTGLVNCLPCVSPNLPIMAWCYIPQSKTQFKHDHLADWLADSASVALYSQQRVWNWTHCAYKKSSRVWLHPLGRSAAQISFWLLAQKIISWCMCKW